MFHTVEATPALSTTIYHDGDAVGGLLEFSGVSAERNQPTLLRSLSILDNGQQKAHLKLFIFSEKVVTPPAGNTAFLIEAAERGKIKKVIDIPVSA
jgi:hypothetical protein